ncbi:MAG TPA: ABC transporter permease [Anaerolineales bacterium]
MSQEEQTLKEKQEEPPPKQRSLLKRIFVRQGTRSAILVPILAVFTALVIGAIIILVSTPAVIAAWRNFLSAPGEALSLTWITVRDAYLTLFQGAFGSPAVIVAGIKSWAGTGDSRALREALRPFSESLTISTPYIFAGLGVALGFQGNLFNIGAEGQIFVGGLASVFVGYSISGLPWFIHLPLALMAGIAAGMVWGAVPGFLKARTGAHEVINTIMMNYIAFRLTDFLLTGPMARPDGLPITPEIKPSAYLPLLFATPMRVHWGFILALGAAVLVYWFLWKTPIGMEIRMTGQNLHAARYAGVSISVIIVLTMVLSGALAGLAGTSQVLGVDHRLVRAFSTGYGFDSISLALLGNSHPFGVVLASLLFGFLRGGAARMQSVAGVPVEIIRIIQGLIIVFVAAPEIIRSLYRLKEVKKTGPVVAQTTEQS